MQRRILTHRQRAVPSGGRSLIALWLGLGLALGLAVLLAMVWLQAPTVDLVVLAFSLLVTGLVSVGLGFAGMRWLRRGRVRIWLQVTLTYLFGVAIALCNIFVTARLMFISTQDLPLLALLILFAAVIATGLGAALSHVFAQRVSALHQSAAAIARGDLTARVAVTGEDELAALARTFNHMADQLAASAAERERQEQVRRELIAAISHDLRTPLASLRAMTEALADGVVDDAATTVRYYDTMRGQIGQLTQLIEDLFSLARLDAGAAELELQPVEPAQLVADVLAGHSPQAEARGVRLEAQVAPGVGPALAAPQQLTRVLDNLLANALRHTPRGGTITLRVTEDEGGGWRKDEGRRMKDENSVDRTGSSSFVLHPSSFAASFILFEVADTGEGIAPEDLPRVFERFYRGEKSRSRASGGAGLGLAIARGIVEAHGGTITIASTPGVGTSVRFTVPRIMERGRITE